MRTRPGYRLATDSGALLIANLSFVITGLLRMKISAIRLGPQGLGVVAQLTQLSALVVFASALGLGTGTRLALSRPSMSDQKRAETGKMLLLIAGSVAVLGTILAIVAAGPIAGLLLGSPEYATQLRLALLAVPMSTISQLLLPLAQSWGEFRRIAVGAIGTATLGTIATLPLLGTSSLNFAVATIPVASAIQLACIVTASRAAQRTLRASPRFASGTLRDILSVGSLSFVLGGSAMLGETLVRIFMVRNDGLTLVANYQPIYLMSTSGFGLILGSVGTALLVHITRVADIVPRESISASLNSVLRKVLIVVGGTCFLVQFGALIYIPLIFSPDLMDGASALAFQMPVEVVRASVWILGSALLPLSLRKHWIAAGLVTVATQTIVIWALLGHVGLAAVPWGSGAGWVAGLLVTLNGLSREHVAIDKRTWQLMIWTIALTLGAATTVHPGPAFKPSLAPLAFSALWGLPLLGLLVNKQRAKAMAS
jgi:O-antigen/teichoic acid export membrane protein